MLALADRTDENLLTGNDRARPRRGHGFRRILLDSPAAVAGHGSSVDPVSALQIGDRFSPARLIAWFDRGADLHPPQDPLLVDEEGAADRRAALFVEYPVRTPDFANGVLHALASNWTASAVLQMRSGAPVNVLTGLDNALNGFFTQTGGATQRPNQVSGVDPYGDTDSLTNFYNIAAFAQPATGTLGDTPFNALRGPGFWQWDQAFTRGFPIGNGQRLELRAEGINITNHFNRGDPGLTLNNPATFGRITTLAVGATPRIWQFAVKYVF